MITMPNRIEQSKGTPWLTIEYNTVIAFFTLLVSIFTRKVEVVIPHNKGKPLVNLMFRYSRNLSIIDDGMDTFRDVPRNIDLETLRSNISYYTFDYDLPLADWLSKLHVIKACPVSALVSDMRPIFSFERIRTIIIESPGVVYDAQDADLEAVLFIRHPNVNKNGNNSGFINTINGKEYSVEKSLQNYSGKIVVGESMVLIFALSCLEDLVSLRIMMKKNQFENLSVLHEILRKHELCIF